MVRTATWKLSMAFHPQTDRQTECQNQTLEQYLRAYVVYQQDDWGTWLPMAEFTYNNSFHPTLGYLPFYALQGADLVIQQWLIKEMDANIPATKEWAEAIATMHADVEVQWVCTWCTQAIYTNWKMKPQVFNVGDMVWLLDCNLKTWWLNKKLNFKFIGFFKVKNKVRTQVYHLELPHMIKVHPVFHVSLLKLCKGSNYPDKHPPPEVIGDEEKYEVEKILDSCCQCGHVQYLVKWKGYPNCDNQWEPPANLGNAEDVLQNFLLKYSRKPDHCHTTTSTKETPRIGQPNGRR